MIPPDPRLQRLREAIRQALADSTAARDPSHAELEAPEAPYLVDDIDPFGDYRAEREARRRRG